MSRTKKSQDKSAPHTHLDHGHAHKSADNHTHESHPEMIKRLKRVSGHLNKVILMLEEQEECVDILQQLSAVISALTNSRTTLLLDHVNTCFSGAIKPGQEHVLEEIETVIKRTIKD